MKRKAYPNYKPSGVEWLGDVPEHWEVKKTKYCFRLKAQKATTEENPIALENIESWTGRKIDTETEFDGEGIAFESGDILFGKLRPYLAKVYLAEKAGESIGDIFVLGSCAEVIPRYGAECFRTANYIEIIDGSTYGSKMPRASWEFMGSLPFLLPPLPEQQSIADYLDRETSRIDSLIAKKQRLLSLLAERRTALISRAVTKGLNSNVKMKPSGVEWLGEVPEHWEVKRLKFLLKEPLTYGANEAAELDDTDLPRFIRITDVDEQGNLREETFRSLPEEIAKNYLLQEGDLLFARSGATVGKTFFYQKAWGRAAYAGYLIRARLNVKMAFPNFINLITKAGFYHQWVHSMLIQATIQNVSAEKYASFIVPLPPLPEQHAIAAYLDRETAKIDALSAKVETIIERLKEYRTALISEAVTGKIDLREAV
jgi:restriction endonuclease S subunit